MASVVKDILYGGTYTLADGRKFVCKPEEIPHYHRRMKDFLSAGIPIPIAWEHQNGFKPKTRQDIETHLAEKTRRALGWAEEAILNPGGFLESKIEIPLEDDRKKLPVVRFVSPTIEYDWTDPTGKTWEGPSITQLAVTTRPVQMNQKPFALSNKSKRQPICLSLASVQLGENAMADEFEADEGADTKMKDVIEKLKTHNLVLGDDTTKENFFDRICVALDTKAAHEGKDTETEDEDVEAMATETPTPMMMSMQAKIAELEAKVKKSDEKIGAERKRSARSKARSLLSVFGKAKVDALLAELDKEPVTLSVDGLSPVSAKIDAYIEAAKAVQIAGGGFVNLSAEATEAERTIPENDETRHDVVDEKKAKETGKAMAAMAGYKS